MELDNRYAHGRISDSLKFCSPSGPLEYLDHWIPLTPLDQMAQTDYDVIIVGSGAGGGAVLWRLCDKWRKSGKRIALLERGDLLLPSHAINLPTFNHKRLIQFIENPKYKHRIADSGTSIPLNFSQFFALGGRTIHWGTGSPRFHPLDFITWPITHRELNPYYKIAEQVMGVGRKFTKGSHLQHYVIERLRAIGYNDAMDFPLAIDFNVRKIAVHSTSVFSSIDLLAYSLNVGNFDLAVNARAVQVFTEKGSASGVKVLTPDMKPYFIKGKNIVLAASTLENPRILLYSGIRGEAIGRYLINHTSVSTQGKMRKSDCPDPSGNLAILIPRTDRRLYQIEIHRHQPYEYDWNTYTTDRKQRSKLNMQGFGVVEPRLENCVTLDSIRLDESGIPKLNVHFTYSQRDLDIVQHMVSSMQYQARGIGLSLTKSLCLNAPGLDNHESGTCRMGKHPYNSVTNEYGEVHHVSNLFVADSSVLPFIGGTNPTLTIVALALRTADYIHFKVSNQ
jgi:choline dehydrogenase-like flavoprotein